jgi:hypothetical protein
LVEHNDNSRALDFEQIRQLAYLYALGYDRRDMKLLESLWKKDVEPVEYPYLNVHTVRRDFPRGWAEGNSSMLIVANHVIRFDSDDAAHGYVYCVAQVDRDGSFVEQSIVYEDRYARGDEGWLFVDRRHDLWFGHRWERNPRDAPAANWPRGQVGRGILYDDR